MDEKHRKSKAGFMTGTTLFNKEIILVLAFSPMYIEAVAGPAITSLGCLKRIEHVNSTLRSLPFC